LPKAFQTLKNWVYRKLPTAKLESSNVQVETFKLPAGPPHSNDAQVRMYYFDKSELVKRLLMNPIIKSRMYFGLQSLVDEEVELWEGRLWGESILSTSGQCAYIKDVPLFPGDTIVYTLLDSANQPALGRVRQICIDRRQNSKFYNKVSAVVEPLVPFKLLPQSLRDSNDLKHLEESDYFFLVEDQCHVVPVVQIHRKAVAHFADEGVELQEKPPYVRVSHIVSGQTSRPISRRHELLAEAEIRVYGLEYLTKLMKKTHTVISVPTTTFIDGFTSFRKTQLSLLGVYVCPANLPLRDRLSQLNQYPLTLGPMGSTTIHAAQILRAGDSRLARGFETTLHDSPVTIISFDLGKTGDMPQQNQNCSMSSHRAARSCRQCYVTDVDRSNISYNIKSNGRYLPLENRNRAAALALKTKTAREDALRGWGIKEKPSMWIPNQPALLPNRMTPQECCHILVNGLAQIYQEILVDQLLKESAKPVYSEAIREWPITPDWSRLQSPTHHHRSYSYNQYGQVAQLNPYALRSILKATHITEKGTKSIKAEFANELASGWSIPDVIVHLYAQLPRVMLPVFSRQMTRTGKAELQDQLRCFVVSYRRFITACVPVASRKGYWQRSNIHAVLHIVDTINDYGTAINVICSPGTFFLLCRHLS
jgi:hypothetical protein